MYINYLHIKYYLIIFLLGLIVGQFVKICVTASEYDENIFTKNFFYKYIKMQDLSLTLMLITGISYLILLYNIGIKLELLKYMLVLPVILALIWIDYKKQDVAKRTVFFLIQIGMVFSIIEGMNDFSSLKNKLIGMGIAFIIFIIINVIGVMVAGKDNSGYGDIKVMAALGLIFGVADISLIMIIGFLFSVIFGLLFVILKKGNIIKQFSLGLYLGIGAIIVMLIPYSLYIPYLQTFLLIN